MKRDGSVLLLTVLMSVVLLLLLVSLTHLIGDLFREIKEFKGGYITPMEAVRSGISQFAKDASRAFISDNNTLGRWNESNENHICKLFCESQYWGSVCCKQLCQNEDSNCTSVWNSINEAAADYDWVKQYGRCVVYIKITGHIEKELSSKTEYLLPGKRYPVVHLYTTEVACFDNNTGQGKIRLTAIYYRIER